MIWLQCTVETSTCLSGFGIHSLVFGENCSLWAKERNSDSLFSKSELVPSLFKKKFQGAKRDCSNLLLGIKMGKAIKNFKKHCENNEFLERVACLERKCDWLSSLFCKEQQERFSHVCSFKEQWERIANGCAFKRAILNERVNSERSNSQFWWL